ncbi:hypothetical protein MTO96_050555 [Rhipicephalus appendiculatus]
MGTSARTKWLNQSIPIEADGSFSSCTMYDPPEQDENLGNRTIIRCDVWNYATNRVDSIVSQFDLVCDRRFLYDFSAMLPLIGIAIMSPIVGIASDRLGRRPVTLLLAITVLISSICCSLPAMYAFFVAMRVLSVSSANGAYLLTFVLVYEVTGNERRPLFTPLTLRSGQHRRAAVFPTIAFVLWCLHLQESPGWQVATWRLNQAEANVLVAVSLNRGVSVAAVKPTVEKTFHRLRQMENILEQMASPMASSGIFETDLTRRSATAAFFTRFTMCAIYYGLMIAEPLGGHIVEVAHVVLTAVAYVLIVDYTSNHGIQKTLTATLIALSWGGLSEAVLAVAEYGAAVAVVHAVTKALALCALGLLMCYTGEVFRTQHRSAGVSMALSCGGLGALTGMCIAKYTGEELVFKAFVAAMALCSVAVMQW